MNILTDEEISACYEEAAKNAPYMIGTTRTSVARAIEAAVLEKVGKVDESKPYPDDFLIDAFTPVLKMKLAKAAASGRSGWQDCSKEYLSLMLREHVEKGDPRDVANFCAMLWWHGYDIAPMTKVDVEDRKC